MSKEHESILEPYLKRICEQNEMIGDQNEMIINLLKVIADQNNKSVQEKDQDIETIIAKVETFTKRERQVIELVTQGMLNKQMAYDLGLSLSTIESHRSSIMKKMGAKNVAQLTKDYMRFQSLRKY